MALLNFNADSVQPATSYDTLPSGKYLAMAIASELKPTKNGTGEYLQITFEILDGQFKGRKLFSRMNIRNANKTAEDIAQRELSALCHAVGVMNLQDSEQLHNTPVTLDVKVDPAKGEYAAQNRIAGYSKAGGSAPAPVAQAPVAAGNSAPVWKRKTA